MDRNEQILSLIGLCLRGRNLEVGEEPVEAVSRARDARLILLASDAADNTARRAQRFAEAGQCIWLRVPFTRRELGQAVGRGSAAIAAVTDIGLAAAVVRRLAELEPEKYDEDLTRLELKAKRAAERKSEAAQHEKNLRRGIKHPKRENAGTDGKTAEAGTDGSRSDAGKPSGSSARPKPAAESPHKKPAGRRYGAGQGSSDGRKPARKGGASFRGTGKRTGQPSRSGGSRKSNRPRPGGNPNPYAHSRPVKKGKGSFRKKEG